MMNSIFGEVDEEFIHSNISKIQDILNGSQAKECLLTLLFISKGCVEQGIDQLPDHKDDIIDDLKQLFECVIEDLEEYEPNSEYES